MLRAVIEAVIRTARIVKTPTPIRFILDESPNYVPTYYLDNSILRVYPEMAYSSYFTRAVSAVFVVPPFNDSSEEELDHIADQVASSMRVSPEPPIG